jgi:hypothetical protein
MRVLIEPENADGDQVVIGPGQICRIGRTAPAEFVFTSDIFLSGTHFAIDCSIQDCLVRDLASRNGTFLNGVKITESILADGDRIFAGQTHFRVRIEKGVVFRSSLPPIFPSQLRQPQKRLFELLRKQPVPVFALLDGARDDRVLDLLRNSGERYQSLYEGTQGRELDNWAPYLVELPKDSRLLLWLLHEGWGKSWGVCLTSGATFLEMRRHFRHFLLVDGEDGKQAYFRFYDPRVLRLFLPTCSPQERREFFGPVSSYFAEDDTQTNLVQFSMDTGGFNLRQQIS